MERNKPYVLPPVPACRSPRSALPRLREGWGKAALRDGGGSKELGWGGREAGVKDKAEGSSPASCCPVWSQPCCLSVQDGRKRVLDTACFT